MFHEGQGSSEHKRRHILLRIARTTFVLRRGNASMVCKLTQMGKHVKLSTRWGQLFLIPCSFEPVTGIRTSLSALYDNKQLVKLLIMIRIDKGAR